MGNGTTFEWQHDARWQSDYKQIRWAAPPYYRRGERLPPLSLFDNAATDFAQSESQARGLLLDLNTDNMSTSLAVEVFPYNHTTSPSQGSMNLQPNGNWLVGYVWPRATSPLR